MFVLLVVAIIVFVCFRRRKNRAKDATKKGNLVKIRVEGRRSPHNNNNTKNNNK